MSTNPEDPQHQDDHQQDDDQHQDAAGWDGAQEQPLTAEDVLGAEQTDEARAADQGTAQATAPADGAEADTTALAQERLEDLRRLQAEFVNYKNRTSRERDQLRDHVISDVISSLVPVLDDIDAGRGAGDITEGPFAAIAVKLEETLVKQGLERVGVVGERFDPAIHDGVLQQPAEGVEPDHVSLVLRSGFRVGTRIVRPAQVAVAPEG